MGSPQRLWRRCAAEDCLFEEFTDDVVVFDPSTGETHFVTQLPALILAELDTTPRSVETLIERLAGPTGLEQAAEQQILDALSRLEAAELVESEPTESD